MNDMDKNMYEFMKDQIKNLQSLKNTTKFSPQQICELENEINVLKERMKLYE